MSNVANWVRIVQEGEKVGIVHGLYTCTKAGEPMEFRTEVRALVGRGLAEDRYASDQGAYSRSARQAIRHVTIIAREAIEQANRKLALRGLDPFGAHETRRNIVTEDVDVNSLLTQEFLVGKVRMRGAEPTTPCDRVSLLVKKTGFREAFADYGGVRAQILSEGIISLGDFITCKV